MAAHTTGGDPLLKIKDITLLKVCRDYLVRVGMLNGSETCWPNVEGYVNDINWSVHRYIKNTEMRNEFIGQVISNAKSQCFSSDSVNWLRESPEACCWLWVKIRVGCFHDYFRRHHVNDDYVSGSTMHTKYGSVEKIIWEPLGYKNLGFDIMPEPSSHEARLRLVIEYLNRFSDDFEYKSKLLSSAHIEWTNIYTRNDQLRWLDRENEEQCEWVWDYIYSNILVKYKWDFIDDIYITPPTVPHEKYLYSYAFFYNWFVPSSDKELFVYKIKNAWGQKKFRKKKAAKRSINTYIDVEVGKKLDELVGHYDLTIHRTLEMLIKREYERLKGKGI